MTDESVVGDPQDIVRMEIELDKLKVMEWNPNEMDEKEYKLLLDNIREVGFIDPVTAVPLEDGTYGIIGGAHRWRAAHEVGRKTVPVDVVQGDKWKDEDVVKFQNVRMNVIHGKMNPDKFLKLYNDMAEKYGKDKVAALMGYTSEVGIRKIVKNVAKSMKESLPPEMAAQFEQQAKDARTVGDLERIIQHLFQEHGDSVKYNFMVFAWGGKEHIYVSMSKKVHSAMKKIMKASRTGEVDINELLGDAIEEVAESLEKRDNTGTARA